METLDFDRFLAEKRGETLTVRVYGKSYRVRKEIPALVPVLLARCGEGGDAGEKGRVLVQAGDLVFGRAAIDEFCGKGMTAPELGALMERVFARILGEEDEQVLDDDGATEEAPAK